uniref:(2,3-dihydroxybenzoyl)adenylate synthase n=1 Tax=Dietzia sp. TaxID=1871616 RepID=UPI002FDB1455
VTVARHGGVNFREIAGRVLDTLRAEGTPLPLVLLLGAESATESATGTDAAREEKASHMLALGEPGTSAVTEEGSHEEGAATGPAARPDPEHLAFLQLSGGTTGTPKLIPRTHADYLYSIREQAALAGCDERTRMLVVLPASHNFTMSSPGIIGVLMHGGACVFCDDPTPSAAFERIETERCTMVSLVPPLALTWLATRGMSKRDLSSLEVMQVGGAKFPEVAARRIEPEIGCTVQQVFGMAEGLCNFTKLDDPDDLRVTTQGHPVSPADEISIRDDDGRPVAPGERGNLWTRGPYTIRGYLGGVDAESFDDEGFYCSGDIVRRLDNGYLVVEGRAKDQINRGGEKISAEEVENHLLAHPAVDDVALVAVPDKVLGERSCAYVISTAPPAAAELKEFVRSRGIAAYKVPDLFEFAAEFPSTGVGKTSRRDLRRILAAHLASARA